MWTTSFGHSISRNQHCVNLRSHLGSAVSFVLNQLQKYNIRDIPKSQLMSLEYSVDSFTSCLENEFLSKNYNTSETVYSDGFHKESF